jgi:hypothetical protein
MQQAMVQYQAQNHGQPDIDNMTYEELLELEDNLGKVSKGLK